MYVRSQAAMEMAGVICDKGTMRGELRDGTCTYLVPTYRRAGLLPLATTRPLMPPIDCAIDGDAAEPDAHPSLRGTSPIGC